jgi:tetratricopeptide (TPR) repeat protein
LSKKKKNTGDFNSATAKTQAAKKTAVNFRKYYYIIFCFAFALYANTIGNKYAFDDSVVITANPYTQKGFSGISYLATHDLFAGMNGSSLELTGGRFRPIPLISHAIEWQLFGEAPGMSHFINVLLFALTCVLLFKTLLKIIPDMWLVAFLSTLIFAAHPIHSEVVANIKSRDEIFSLVFLLLSLNYLFSFISSGDKKENLFSWVFYLLALLSKENGLTLLAIIPLTLYTFKNMDLKQAVLKTIPYLCIALLYLVARMQLLQTSKITESTDLMENPFYGISFLEKIATVCLTMGYYIKLLVLPHPLSSDYSLYHIPIVSFADVFALISFAACAGLITFAIIKIKSRNILAYTILFYFLSVSIVSNLLVNIGAPMGERFLFLPSVAFCLAAAHLFNQYFNSGSNSSANVPQKIMLPIGAVLMLFSVKAISRNTAWHDNLTLFAADIKTVPNSAKANYYYGNELLNKALNDKTPVQEKQLLLQEAKFYNKRAAELFPKFHHSFYNLGQIYVQQNNADSAIYFLNKVLALYPTHVNTQGLMGKVYGQLKNQPAKAIEYLQKAILYNPGDLASIEHLGICYAMMGDFKNALETFNKSLSKNSNSARTLNNIGGTYMNMGDTINGRIFFEKAKRATAP